MTDYDKLTQDIAAKWKDNIHYIVDAELTSDQKAHELRKDKDAFAKYVKEAVTAKIYKSKSPKIIDYKYIPIGLIWMEAPKECPSLYDGSFIGHLLKQAKPLIEQITQQIVADWG